LLDITGAISESTSEAPYSMRLQSAGDKRTIEFDIAVSAEEKNSKSGGAGIKVLQFLEAGGKLDNETKNSTVSRIKFGINVNLLNKEDQAKLDAKNEAWENQKFKTEY